MSEFICGERVPYPQELSAFRLEECEEKFRVVAIGDSVTLCARWEREKGWPGILEKILGDSAIVVNAGIGGTSSSLGLMRWRRDVSPVRPHCVIVNFLLNDSHIRFYESRFSYCVQCTRDRMEANLSVMIELARSIGAEPVLWTPPPVPPFRESFKSEAHLRIQMELLKRYLEAIERLAELVEVPLVNLWRSFPELVEKYPGKYFNPPDGYHSNDLSQPIIAREIGKAVEPLIGKWKANRA